MTNLEWLLDGDEEVVQLVKKYLLGQSVKPKNKGFINDYLKRYNAKTKTWGNGYYGPKWVSTHYTLLDLLYMGVEPTTKEYHESLKNYLTVYWEKYKLNQRIESMDLCITGMLINLVAYADIEDNRLVPMVDYLLDRMMNDGGWNCLWRAVPSPKISSVHTTINVLEGLSQYKNHGYTYRINEVQDAMNHAIELLLSRHLILKRNSKEPVHEAMTRHHFPFRWKYDYLRVLEFLAQEEVPYDPRMDEALDLLVHHLKRGKLTKGTTYAGLVHFPLETTYYGRFNTFRAYKVLKFYRPDVYEMCLKQAF